MSGAKECRRAHIMGSSIRRLGNPSHHTCVGAGMTANMGSGVSVGTFCPNLTGTVSCAHVMGGVEV